MDKEDAYSGVVSMETIRVAFLLAAMNDLEICAADISTAFLYGKTRERVYICGGKEFGKNQGKVYLIDKGLYDLQPSAARFHDKLASSLRKMGYKPCKADFDLWMCDKDDHYEYIAVYVDDLLVFSKDPIKVIETLRTEYDLKGVGLPEYYLRGDVDIMNSSPSTKDIDSIMEVNHDEKDKHLNVQWLHHNVKTTFSARTYIKNTIERLERMIGITFKHDRKSTSRNG